MSKLCFRPRSLGATIGLLFAFAAQAAPETAGVQIEAGFTRDSNVTRARDGDNRLSDHFYSLDIRKRFERNPSEHTAVIAVIRAGGERYSDNVGLSNGYLGLQLDGLYRASGALAVPTYRAFLHFTSVNYQSELRDGSRLSAGLSVQKFLDDQYKLIGELAYNVRHGRDTVFDLKDISLRGIVEYQMSSQIAFYLISEYRDGDIVSSAPPSLAYVDIAKAIVLDDAFKEATRYAYRFGARTYAATVGFNWTVGQFHALDFSVRAGKSVAKDRLEAAFQWERSNYLDNQISIFYLLRF